MSQFNEEEKLILEKGSKVRGKEFPIWEQHFGVFNIYEETQFNDPDGYLPLSVRQMKHLKAWIRPIQVANPLKIMNGRIAFFTRNMWPELSINSISELHALSPNDD